MEGSAFVPSNASRSPDPADNAFTHLDNSPLAAAASDNVVLNPSPDTTFNDDANPEDIGQVFDPAPQTATRTFSDETLMSATLDCVLMLRERHPNVYQALHLTMNAVDGNPFSQQQEPQEQEAFICAPKAAPGVDDNRLT